MESTNRTCRWVCRRLPLLAGGDLTGLERRRVERHLIGCSSCQDRQTASSESLAVLHEVAALGLMGAGIASPSETPSVWPALARQIRESKHHPEPLSVAEWFRSLLATPAASWVGSGLAATALVGLGLGWYWMEGQSDQANLTAPLVVAVPAQSVLSPPTRQVQPEPNIEESNAVLDPIHQGELALPGEVVAGDRPKSRPIADPFASPTPLRLDYDLDWWTLSGPLADSQRAY